MQQTLAAPAPSDNKSIGTDVKTNVTASGLTVLPPPKEVIGFIDSSKMQEQIAKWDGRAYHPATTLFDAYNEKRLQPEICHTQVQMLRFDTTGPTPIRSLEGWRIHKVEGEDVTLRFELPRFYTKPADDAREYLTELAHFQNIRDELSSALKSNEKEMQSATNDDKDADLSLLGALFLERERIKTELKKPFVFQDRVYPPSDLVVVEEFTKCKMGLNMIAGHMVWITRLHANLGPLVTTQEALVFPKAVTGKPVYWFKNNISVAWC